MNRRPTAFLGHTPAAAKLLVLLSTAGPHVLHSFAAPLLGATVEAAKKDNGSHHVPIGSDEFYMKLAFSAFLVLLGGVFSGLTLGLMGLDMVNLQVLSSSGSEKEQKSADKVLKLLSKGRHWVLVVLLLSNVVVNESLPIFLDSILGGGVGAVVLSTTLIVIFGEIIPQAVCARYGLQIGSACVPFVLVLMYAEFPVAFPIAKLLDRILGDSHGTTYKKAELKTFVGLHGRIGEDLLNEDEVTIISAVLELSDKSVKDIMTPIDDVYSLPSNAVLNQKRVDEILALGYSRIPIHANEDKRSYLGMLIVKKLISYDPDDAKTVSQFPLSVLPETGPSSTCLDALNYFQQGRSHMLLVSSTPGVDGGALGVVSLEDVIEEMIGEEIIDESDVYVDIHNKIKVVRGPTKPQVASGKALKPLLQGVIERRTGVRRKTTHVDGDSTPAPTTSTATNIPEPLAKAFSKVKVRGGGPAERRSDLVRRISEANSTVSAANVPIVVTDELEAFTERDGVDGERKPLLKK